MGHFSKFIPAGSKRIEFPKTKTLNGLEDVHAVVASAFDADSDFASVRLQNDSVRGSVWLNHFFFDMESKENDR
ncbi:unnamed protein product [Phytophthora lilii]|uniref:Unnamed protein product n=1 Tax=Phytophthora lilii TaxID=2077276 RepID=A0A9W6XJF7_9STRA|nr:unnamed protein product [Phytophthora lilii]